MKVFLDSNILISAVLFPNGTAAQAYQKAISYPYQAMISAQTKEELYAVFLKKFPQKTELLNLFFGFASSHIETVAIPAEPFIDESKIRDSDDRTVFRAAKAAAAELIITGDKDLLESGIQHPEIITPSNFLKSY